MLLDVLSMDLPSGGGLIDNLHGAYHTYTYTGPPFQALADSLKDEYMTWPPFQAPC
jgi:hypothetical protein